MKKNRIHLSIKQLSMLTAVSLLSLTACDKKAAHDHAHETGEKHEHAHDANKEKHITAEQKTDASENQAKGDEHHDDHHDDKDAHDKDAHDKDAHDKEHHEHAHDDKVEHIGPHVHGEASMNVAIDGNKLVFDIDTPAMNVLGFEHAPKTDEQKNLVVKAKASLSQAKQLFNINGGDCKVASMDVDMPFAADEHAHDEHKDHDAHDHDEKHDEHKHEKKDAKHDEHEHEHKETDVHSDIEVKYEYTCKSPADIKSVDVALFNTFAGFTKLNVQWVAGDKQGAQVLTKTAHELKIAP